MPEPEIGVGVTVHNNSRHSTPYAAEGHTHTLPPYAAEGHTHPYAAVDHTHAATAYVKVSDVKSSGTAGGTFTAGSYVARILNTKDIDTASICTLSSNQITLPAGTYLCSISAPALQVNKHKAILKNITDNAVTLIGTTESNPTDVLITRSFIKGQFTISDTKVFEVQHRAQTTRTTVGFGEPCSFGDSEIYTIAEFWKVA